MKKHSISIVLAILLALSLCAGSFANADYLTLPEGSTPDANGVYRGLGNYLIELWYDEADFAAARSYIEKRFGLAPSSEEAAVTDLIYKVSMK